MSDFKNFKIRPVLHLVKIFDVFKLLNIHFTSNTYFLWDQILNNGGYFYIISKGNSFVNDLLLCSTVIKQLRNLQQRRK